MRTFGEILREACAQGELVQKQRQVAELIDGMGLNTVQVSILLGELVTSLHTQLPPDVREDMVRRFCASVLRAVLEPDEQMH